jgi:hypothetical protein
MKPSGGIRLFVNELPSLDNSKKIPDQMIALLEVAFLSMA